MQNLTSLVTDGRYSIWIARALIGLFTLISFGTNVYTNDHLIRYISGLPIEGPSFSNLLIGITNPSLDTLSFGGSVFASFISSDLFLTYNLIENDERNLQIAYYIDNPHKIFQQKFIPKYLAALVLSALQFSNTIISSSVVIPRATDFWLWQGFAGKAWINYFLLPLTYFIAGAVGLLNLIPTTVDATYYSKIRAKLATISKNASFRYGVTGFIFSVIGIYTFFAMFSSAASNNHRLENSFNFKQWQVLVLGISLAFFGNLSFAIFQTDKLINFFVFISKLISHKCAREHQFNLSRVVTDMSKEALEKKSEQRKGFFATIHSYLSGEWQANYNKEIDELVYKSKKNSLQTHSIFSQANFESLELDDLDNNRDSEHSEKSSDESDLSPRFK